MTDKIQKIREELARLKEETSIGLSEHENGVEQGRMEIINALSLFLDSLQEEQFDKDEEILILKDQIESLHAARMAIKETHRIELEKQAGYAKFCDSIQVGDKVTRNQDGMLINLSQLKRVAKPAEKYNITGIGSKNAQGKLGKMIKNLKSADKVETKFKAGNWVVIDGEVLHVKEVTEDGYLTDEGGHIPFRCEKEAMLWTIQDAKDGDVLTTDTWTFIFNKYQDKFVCYHCAASAFNNFSISDTGAFDSNYVHPATKEQRDLLFQKMHEAGYEWDAEKKELKKIEQKPAEIEKGVKGNDREIPNSAWSEDDETYSDHIITAWKPSEEQITVLHDVAAYIDNSIYPNLKDILVNLYLQLKKLREERFTEINHKNNKED